MAHTYNLWLEYAEDWRTLRDFLFDACNCTGFVGTSMKAQSGRPGALEEIYSIHSVYNLIALHGRFAGRAYKNDVQVAFTLNKPDRWQEWEREVIHTSVRWLARHSGDALLDWDGLAILGRKGAGPIVINDFSKNRSTSRVEDAQRSDYQTFITENLERERLVFTRGPLDPI